MIYDHRGRILKDVSSSINFRHLSITRNWFVYTGIYCPKHKNTEPGSFQDQFIITDVLVWNGEYLLGSTLLERLSLIDYAFDFTPDAIEDGNVSFLKFLNYTELSGIFIAKYYTSNFKSLYDQIIELKYNGAILNKKESVLLDSTKTRNNRQDQIICRNRTTFFNF